MSRSKRKNPIWGNAAVSEKKDKRFANRKFRHQAKQKLMRDEEEFIEPDMNIISNIWSHAKDGKSYISPTEYGEKEWFKKAMRK